MTPNLRHSDSFESEDFSTFGWVLEGDSDWFIDSDAYDGDFSARSGAIGNNSETALVLPLDILVTSEVRFWKKVSTEENFDFFTFYIELQ